MASPLKQHIERHSRILAILRQIESEPELDAALRDIYSTPKPGPSPSTTTHAAENLLLSPANGNGNGRGKLKRMVLEVLQDARIPLSTETIAELMRSNGFEFKTDTPTISINEALNSWREEGKTRIDHLEGRKQFWVRSPVQESSEGNA
jgi:hypothetical protein